MAALGASVDWLRGRCTGGDWTGDELFAAAAAVPAGADGLVFLPYLAGERAPVFDEEARGAFVGPDARPRARAPRPGRARGGRVRAALTSPSRSPRPAPRSASSGWPAAASHGDTWARIKADVLGVPVAIPVDRRHGGPRRGDPRGRGRRGRAGPRGGRGGDDGRRPADRAGSRGARALRRPVRRLPVAVPGARPDDARARGRGGG